LYFFLFLQEFYFVFTYIFVPLPSRMNYSILAVFLFVALVKCNPITVFGTGFDASGNALSGGSSDPHWQLDSTPSSSTPVAATVVGNVIWGFPDHPNSQWISPVSDGATYLAVGNFQYSTTFDLSGYDPSSASLSGIMAADDSVLTVLLNGQPVPGISCSICYSYGTAFAINDGFQGGVNTFTFVTSNGGGPAGFQTSLSGTANPGALAFCQNANQADWTPYGQGYYCWNGASAFLQCWGSAPYIQAQSQNCALGTGCHCAYGVECSNHGTQSPCI